MQNLEQRPESATATASPHDDWTVERIAAAMNVMGLKHHTPCRLENLPRAITALEAEAYAESLLVHRNPAFPIGNGLIFAWDQLSQSVSPEAALSFQRIITALITVQAWLVWELGRSLVTNGEEIYEARAAKELEDYQLNRWRKGQDHGES